MTQTTIYRRNLAIKKPLNQKKILDEPETLRFFVSTEFMI